jgi:hypothetical protein
VHRAHEEEVQRAAPRDQEREQIPRHSAGIGGMNRWEAR